MASQGRFPVGLALIRTQIRHLNHTLPISPEVVVKTQKVLSKQAEKIAQHADKHEQFLNKVTYCLGVLSFGLFCYLLGSNPQDIPRLYCLFFICIAPLRWIYYRVKKWHYYLLDFCYYANAIFVTMLLFFPNNEKFFMLCFSFSEGPLAWALIVWRCSLVFSSIDKIISVLIHSLPGTVFFILRWWDPSTFPRHHTEDGGPWPAWPVVNSASTLWLWLFWVPLLAYCVWQALYFLVVEGLRRQRILKDPELKTSYRELARKAERANNIWWYLSGLLGAENRFIMYAIIQAAFTVATMALTVPMFRSYRFHIGFEIFKLSATVWNGGNFIFNVMPRQAVKQMKQHVTADGHAVQAVVDPSAATCKITTAEKDANSESTASLAKFMVEKIVVPKQGACELCRKAGSESLRIYGNPGMNQVDEDLGTSESGGSLFQTMSRLIKNPNGMHLHKRQTAFTGNLDSQIRGRDWNGHITCAS